MGLLDSILGSVMGNTSGSQSANPMLEEVLRMIQSQPGGLGGMLDSFRQGGLGHLVDSWISSGHNLPVSPDQISSVLGNGQLAELAQRLGMSHGDLSASLSKVLPGVIDKLTPTGQVPDAGALGGLLDALRNK